MRFDCITLFPELIEGFVTHGVIRRAFVPSPEAHPQIALRCHNPRAHTTDRHKTVDDRPYGGGPGMVMLAEPLEATLRAVQADWTAAGLGTPHVITFSPSGQRITHARVMQLVQSPGAVLLCGRYEGIDQRFIDRHVHEELSLGDFVLSGGELAAMTLLDAVARQLPGVLHTALSAVEESFVDGLLDCPHYSRPERLPSPLQSAGGATEQVPPVLLSGNHAHIARWRREQSLALTAARRPDLLALAKARDLLSKADLAFLRTLKLPL